MAFLMPLKAYLLAKASHLLPEAFPAIWEERILPLNGLIFRLCDVVFGTVIYLF